MSRMSEMNPALLGMRDAIRDRKINGNLGLWSCGRSDFHDLYKEGYEAGEKVLESLANEFDLWSHFTETKFHFIERPESV